MKTFHLFFIFSFFLGIFYRGFTYIGIPAPVPGGKLYITELMIVGIIIIGFFKLSVLKQLRSWIVLDPKVIKYYFFFFLASIIPIFYSDWSNIGLSMREFASYYYSVFFFFPLFLLKEEKQQDALLKIILIATLFALVLILYRVAMGLGNVNSTGELRYGSHETIGILILVCWLFTKPIEKWRFCEWLIFSSATLITVLFINHRSAIISLIVSIFLINFLNHRKQLLKTVKNLWMGCLLLCILAFPISYFYGDVFYTAFERFLTILSPTEETNSSWRLFTWKIIFSDMNFLDYAFGKGWGWQIPMFEFNDRIYGAKGEIRGFHNSLLFYFYHIGMIGLGSLILFIIATYKNALQIIKQFSVQKQAKVNLLIASNIGILIFSLFNVVLEGPYMSFFFWITLGMIYNYPNQFINTQRRVNETVGI
jgi:hypothetical protein